MEEIMDMETIAMTLVGNAGEGRSLAFEALREAKGGNIEKAKELIKEASRKIYDAHHIQTDLICREADGQGVQMNLLLVHAQDHLMTAILAKELIEEMIDLHDKINNK